MSSIKDGPLAVIYLAGKSRDVSPWHVERNIRAVEDVAKDVASLGMAPVCVHAAFRFLGGTVSTEFWKEAARSIMRRCDAVLVTGDNWLTSEGTRNEIRVANDIGLPVYYGLAALTSQAMKLGWI